MADAMTRQLGSSDAAHNGPFASFVRHCEAGFAKADAALERAWLWYGAIALLAAIQISLILLHEPWADELQALMIAQEATDQTELLAWLRGHGAA